jgi:lysophospholipase L1-like esterase
LAGTLPDAPQNGKAAVSSTKGGQHEYCASAVRYLQADGGHLSAEGHAFLAARLLPSVVAALGH